MVVSRSYPSRYHGRITVVSKSYTNEMKKKRNYTTIEQIKLLFSFYINVHSLHLGFVLQLRFGSYDYSYDGTVLQCVFFFNVHFMLGLQLFSYF